MRWSVFSATAHSAVGPQAPSALAGGSCFSYGGANRFRFEGSRDALCPSLSPVPRALLNCSLDKRRYSRAFSIEIARRAAGERHRFFRHLAAVFGTYTMK